jgi:hypothetical protein
MAVTWPEKRAVSIIHGMAWKTLWISSWLADNSSVFVEVSMSSISALSKLCIFNNRKNTQQEKRREEKRRVALTFGCHESCN